MWSVGECGVALFGKQVGHAQEELLAHWSKPHRLIALLLDPGAWDDEDRHRAFLEGFSKRLHDRVVEVLLPDGRDPGQYGRTALWRLINRAVRRAGFDPMSYRKQEPRPCAPPTSSPTSP